MSDEIIVSGVVEKSVLQSFVDVILPLVNESKVHFNDDGLAASMVEPGNVAMHSPVELDAEAFESYESPGSVTLGINIDRLDEILDIADSNTLIEFSVNMETRHLELRFDGVRQSLAMIDPNAIRDEPDTVDLDLDNMAIISGEKIDKALTVAELNSDHVRINADPDAENSLVFSAEGDTDSGQAGWGVDELEATQIQTATESLFSLEYLKAVTDAVDNDDEVEMWFGEEMPIKLSWESVDGQLSVESMIAPRIQKD